MKDSPKTFFIILILFTLLTLLIFWPIFLGKVNLNGHLLVSFSVDKYLGNRHKKYLAIISLSTAFSLFGGYMQTTIYLFIFAFAYMVFRFWTRPFHLGGVLRILTAFVLGILLAAVQLLPSAELYFNSARASVTLRETLFQFLLPLTSLLTFLAPDFFGHPATANFIRGGSAQYYEGIIFIGIAALIFGTYSIFLKSKLVKFLAIFGLISLSLTINLPTSKLFLSLPLPFLSTSIANRILFIPAFCLAVLAAIGMEHWLFSKDKKILKVILPLGVVYILLASYLLAAGFLHFPYFKPPTLETWQAAIVSLRNLAIPFTVFVISAILIFPRIFLHLD